LYVYVDLQFALMDFTKLNLIHAYARPAKFKCAVLLGRPFRVLNSPAATRAGPRVPPARVLYLVTHREGKAMVQGGVPPPPSEPGPAGPVGPRGANREGVE